MATIQFELRRSASASQPYYWRVVAGNGQVLCHSETYVSADGCNNAVAAVKSHRYVSETLPTGVQWYFRLKSPNGEILARSESYRNKADADAAAKLIWDEGPTAPYVDRRAA